MSRFEVGLCLYRDILAHTFQSCLALEKAFHPKWLIQIGADVAFARNKMVTDFLTGKAERLLLLDGDMVFGPEHVLSLNVSLDKHPDTGALSGHYVKWDGSEVPVCNWLRNGGWMKDSQRKRRAESFGRGIGYVDSFGGGFLLIRRDVFEKIEFPWFEAHYDERGYSGNDTSFCKKVKDAGFHPAVDFGLRVGHTGPTTWIGG